MSRTRRARWPSSAACSSPAGASSASPPTGTRPSGTGPPVELTAEIARAWDGHAPWPNLPARLPPMLGRAGFARVRALPVPVVNPILHENTFAYWAARLMAAHAVAQGVAEDRARAWLDALDAAEAKGEFFFSSVPILTTAVAA